MKTHRYGFNGAEKDDEVKGEGNHYDLGFRNYDPRLGRMFSIDPRSGEYPWQSPYAYHMNSLIWQIDYMGAGGDDRKADRVNKRLNRISQSKNPKDQKLGSLKSAGLLVDAMNSRVKNWLKEGDGVLKESQKNQVDNFNDALNANLPSLTKKFERRSGTWRNTGATLNYIKQKLTVQGGLETKRTGNLEVETGKGITTNMYPFRRDFGGNPIVIPSNAVILETKIYYKAKITEQNSNEVKLKINGTTHYSIMGAKSIIKSPQEIMSRSNSGSGVLTNSFPLEPNRLNSNPSLRIDATSFLGIYPSIEGSGTDVATFNFRVSVEYFVPFKISGGISDVK